MGTDTICDEHWLVEHGLSGALGPMGPPGIAQEVTQEGDWDWWGIRMLLLSYALDSFDNVAYPDNLP